MPTATAFIYASARAAPSPGCSGIATTVGGMTLVSGLIMKAVEPIWTEKPETASRVRGRIEAVLDWATARGYREGENPARWRGHLQNLLAPRSKVRRVEHYAALPYPNIALFMADLRKQDGVAARALAFAN